MEVVTKIAPICLALIMFGLGLGLSIADFFRVFKKPKDFIIGFSCQVILLPIIAFILINIISLSPEIALGTMIIAAAPGGVTSNILTKFADGDVALSISLTAIISLICIFTVPLIVLNISEFLNVQIKKEISMLGISLKMFFVVTIPVILGMIFKILMRDFVGSKASLIQRLSIILFLIGFSAAVIEEWDNIEMFIRQAGLITIILNISMIFVGYYIAKFFATGLAQRKSISLECALQNGTLAIFVATQLFDDIIFIVPAATYALIMFLTSIIFVLIVRKIN